MAMINWLDKISEKLLSKGLSLKSDYSILSKNKIFFNEMLRDLLEEYPNKRLQHIILSMSDYYEVEQIYELLDEQNRTTLKKHYIEEDHIRMQLDKKHSRYK